MKTTWFWTGIGSYWPCFKASVKRAPLFNKYCVAASKSEPNCANAATSLYCANSNFKEPETCFMAFICAAEPTRETDKPTLIAGRIPLKNNSVSKKI